MNANDERKIEVLICAIKTNINELKKDLPPRSTCVESWDYIDEIEAQLTKILEVAQPSPTIVR
jgi:methyl coenzyme M reductase subunit C-like uncharacterized protein (methanogenesis marker protein 7)